MSSRAVSAFTRKAGRMRYVHLHATHDAAAVIHASSLCCTALTLYQKSCADQRTLTAGADMLRFSERSPLGALSRGKLLICCPPIDADVPHKLKLVADRSPRRENRSKEYAAMDVDTLKISLVARWTGLRSRLVISTLMMGATDMTVSMPKPSGAPTALPKATPMASTKGTAGVQQHNMLMSVRTDHTRICIRY